MTKLTEEQEQLVTAKEELNRLKEDHTELKKAIKKEQARITKDRGSIPYEQLDIIVKRAIIKASLMDSRSLDKYREIEKLEDKIKMLEKC